jgi:uncharacterized membrane protein YgdD (TMEM256/DUF423 family)
VNKAGTIIAVGALLGLVGVAAGAFGAHGLRGTVSERDLEIWQTAAHYEQVHAVVLVLVGVLAGRGASRPLRLSAHLFAAGVLVFSGTLFAIVLGGPRALGAITPVGGLCLMGGWLSLFAHGLARRRPADAA